nr:MAG TPA: hypothetical protein [Caudoviricetes sp.]
MAKPGNKLRVRGSIPLPGTRTHYLGPFGQRAGIALPSSSRPVDGFFICDVRSLFPGILPLYTNSTPFFRR